MINNARNLALDLQYGIADGSVKALAPDRGGVVETAELFKREDSLRWNNSGHDPLLVRPVNGRPR